LLLLAAGKQTLRLIPPYTISDEEVKQGLGILKSLF
jgi:4-aminobutyrate aminotransferase-like enzyme